MDDSISSTFVSADGRYSGSEWMMLDGGCYRTRGVVLQDGELVCRWTASLTCVCPIVAPDIQCAAQDPRQQFFASAGSAAIGQ